MAFGDTEDARFEEMEMDGLTRVLGPQKVAEKGKSPEISGKSRLVKYYNLARSYV